jgi:hypothetical protein
MLDGYADHYTEPSYFHAQESDLLVMEPVLPELGPVEQGVWDAQDRTPDWTRASGDAAYRRSLILALIKLAGPATGRMTNATGMTYAEAWAESGAPEGADEW